LSGSCRTTAPTESVLTMNERDKELVATRRKGQHRGLTLAINIAGEMCDLEGHLNAEHYVNRLADMFPNEAEDELYEVEHHVNPWLAYALGFITGLVVILTWVKWT
jgi:hypothetical protein